jgi:hypothetical protein
MSIDLSGSVYRRRYCHNEHVETRIKFGSRKDCVPASLLEPSSAEDFLHGQSGFLMKLGPVGLMIGRKSGKVEFGTLINSTACSRARRICHPYA